MLLTIDLCKQKSDAHKVEEIAEYLRIPKSSIYKLAQESRIPSQKAGRHCRIRREAVEQWLDAGAPQRQHTL